MTEADLHVGIFGPGLSGKTYLCKELARYYWRTAGVKSIALDIHGENWGPQTWVTRDPNAFWAMVWAEKRCAVFVDEAADTIDRGKDMTPLFTRIRHSGHKLHVIGHSGASLLPIQRQQLQTLILFKQDEDAARIWAKLFGKRELFHRCISLGRYEFLWCRYWEGSIVQGHLPAPMGKPLAL